MGFVLACDGVWDVLSNTEVISILQQCAPDSKTAATRVVKTAYAAKSLDNLTCTVVYFPSLGLSSSPQSISDTPREHEKMSDMLPTRVELSSPDPRLRGVMIDPDRNVEGSPGGSAAAPVFTSPMAADNDGSTPMNVQ